MPYAITAVLDDGQGSKSKRNIISHMDTTLFQATTVAQNISGLTGVDAVMLLEFGAGEQYADRRLVSVYMDRNVMSDTLAGYVIAKVGI